jgi:predicted GIY-YIG superfamily endonuclease
MTNVRMQCGCLYESGEITPWYVCMRHAQLRGVHASRPNLPIFCLYVLRLRNDKYYVGITAKKDPQIRIKQHGGPFGAKWTQLHRPVETIEIKNLGAITKIEAEVHEQKKTLELIDKYGYNNVRGGQLVYSGTYTKFLGRYFTEYNWNNFVNVMLTVGILLAIIVFLAVRDYLLRAS